jgi:hypothetical protein
MTFESTFQYSGNRSVLSQHEDICLEMTRPILQVEILSKQFEYKNRFADVRSFRSLLGVRIDEGP